MQRWNSLITLGSEYQYGCFHWKRIYAFQETSMPIFLFNFSHFFWRFSSFFIIKRSSIFLAYIVTGPYGGQRILFFSSLSCDSHISNLKSFNELVPSLGEPRSVHRPINPFGLHHVLLDHCSLPRKLWISCIFLFKIKRVSQVFFFHFTSNFSF